MVGNKLRTKLAIFAALPLFGCNDSSSYTLYRNSVLDQGMRLHVATFNSSDGDAYNKENCDIASGLFRRQSGVTVKYAAPAMHFLSQKPSSELLTQARPAS